MPEKEIATGFNVVGIDEVEAFLQSNQVLLLDARPRVFFDMAHLPGAHNLSREQFDADFARLEKMLRSSERSLLIYCADVSCEDGEIVARALHQRGLGPLRVFAGGFAEWEAAGKRMEAAK